MKRIAVIAMILFALLCSACEKKEAPNQAELEHLKGLQANIESRINELEAQNTTQVETTEEVIVFTLPNPDDFDGEYPRLGWTCRELSQNPGYLAERLAYLEIIDHQDVAKMTNYLGTHPDDLTKLVYSYWDYILFVDRLTPRMGAGAEEAAKQTPSVTEPIRACVSGFIT